MSKKLSTKCIHSGGIIDDKFHGNITPIYPSITYDYLKSDAYPRYFNTPNQLSVAKKIAELEGAEDAVLFGSGLASVATTMFSFLLFLFVFLYFMSFPKKGKNRFWDCCTKLSKNDQTSSKT